MNLYPVVHVKIPTQTIDQVMEAYDAEADGVFLIDHEIVEPSRLTRTYAMVRREIGRCGFEIGLNYLSLSPHAVLEYLSAQRDIKETFEDMPDMLWTDDARLGTGELSVIKDKQRFGAENMRYFGGVAFKYTSSYTDSPIDASIRARELMDEVDIVTTSGPGTDRPASIEKIKAIRQAIGEKPLGLASGVSIENIDNSKPYVDDVLVSSSIETAPYSGEFVRPKLYELVQAAYE